MRTKTILALTLAAGLASAVNTATAASVGMHFLGRNADTKVRHAESAGVVAQNFWNNVVTDPNMSGTSLPAIDSSGTFTAVQLVFQASDSWVSDGPTATANDRLMKGILKANPDPDLAPINNTDKMFFTVTNLPAGSYDVLIYGTHNGAGAEMSVNLGAATYYIAEQASFNGTFLLATSTTAGSYADANYARFNGVAAAANGTITVTCTKNIVDPQVADGIGVAAVQVVQVSGSAFAPNTATCSITAEPVSMAYPLPEGSTIAMFTVGTAGPCKVQWRRNGVNIPGATDQTYRGPASMLDNGASFTALVYNNVNTNTSAGATVVVDAFVAPQLTQGFATSDRWEGIGANTGLTGLDDLRAAILAGPPTVSSFIGSINIPDAGIDNFGGRVSGWLRPDVTGSYDFFIRSDDSSAMYINPVAAASGANALPDISDPGAAIINETSCCVAFLEPDDATSRGQTTGYYSPSSTYAIPLTAGKYYGFVAIYKEGTGGDFLQLAWRLATDTTPAATLSPIAGGNLFTMASPSGQRATVTKQPASITTYEAKKAKFSLAVTTTPVAGVYGIQWLKNGQPIAGAVGVDYTTPTLTLADNNTKYKANVYTLAGLVVTDEATLTVLPDTLPPIASAGALVNTNGTTIDLGVGFDEPVTDATASVAANYSVSPGTLSSFTYYSSSKSALLKVTGLVAGGTTTVTVRNVADIKGNVMAATNLSVTVSSKMKWNVVGAAELQTTSPLAGSFGNYVVPVGGDTAFDVYSDSVGEWNTWDEATFVYERITGDFDKKVRVEYQDNSSQWSRAGLIVREVPNFGVNRADQDAGAAARYQKCHVNPVGPTLTGPGTGGNNAWEGNRRIATGAATTSAGGGGNPQYPNAWCRIQRVGDTLTIYRSDDGVNWTQLGATTFANATVDPPVPALAAEVYVGPEFAPENGNITLETDRGTWLAKFRDYGDTAAAVMDITSIAVAGGNVTITWTGGGELQSSDVITGGTWTGTGNSSGTFTAAAAGAAKFYRVAR